MNYRETEPGLMLFGVLMRELLLKWLEELKLLLNWNEAGVVVLEIWNMQMTCPSQLAFAKI